MNVSLTPHLDQFVASKISSGRYNSASEVVREALRLLEERDGDRTARLQTFVSARNSAPGLRPGESASPTSPFSKQVLPMIRSPLPPRSWSSKF